MTASERSVSHGLSGYSKGCRCEVCRGAKSESDRRYREANAEELKAKKRAYYLANRDRVIRKTAEYRRQNPDRAREAIKAAEAKRPDHYREMKRAAISRRRNAPGGDLKKRELRWGTAYRAANPDKRRAWEAARRARQRNADVRVVTERDWRKMVARYRGQCHYCGEVATLTQDHVIPLYRGGRHSIGNIVPACGTCNSSKNDRLIVEWKARRVAAA